MPIPRLVLASASPRRSDLLNRLGLMFDTTPADVDESVRDDEAAEAYVSRLAATKARAVAAPHTITLGADTTVVLDGVILGKPSDSDDAADMIRRLSGRSHVVITGVALIATRDDGSVVEASGVETTNVRFSNLDPDRIRWYSNLDEPLDKAGSYALQGAGGLFADQIDGSFTNVIGLPLGLVDTLMSEIGFDLLDFGAGG